MKGMRDNWDNKLKETLDSLNVIEGLPSWEDFVSSRGMAEPSSQTGLLSNSHNLYWAAAVLAGVLAFAGIYHITNKPDDIPAPYSFNPDVTTPDTPSIADNPDLSLEDDTVVIVPVNTPVRNIVVSNDVVNKDNETVVDVEIDDHEHKVVVQVQKQTKEPVVNNVPPVFDDGETGYIAMKPVIKHKSSLDVYALGMGSGNGNLFDVDIQATDYISETVESHREMPTNINGLEHRAPMIFGAKLRNKWNNRWGWEAGLFYSCYISEGELDGWFANYSYKQNLQYLGASSGINYDLFPNSRLNLSLFAGLSSEVAVSAKGTFKVFPDDISVNDSNVKLSTRGALFSCYGGTSIAYEFISGWALTAEPGFRGTFDNSGHPESYRSKNPLYFTITFGIRKDL